MSETTRLPRRVRVPGKVTGFRQAIRYASGRGFHETTDYSDPANDFQRGWNEARAVLAPSSGDPRQAITCGALLAMGEGAAVHDVAVMRAGPDGLSLIAGADARHGKLWLVTSPHRTARNLLWHDVRDAAGKAGAGDEVWVTAGSGGADGHPVTGARLDVPSDLFMYFIVGTPDD